MNRHTIKCKCMKTEDHTLRKITDNTLRKKTYQSKKKM